MADENKKGITVKNDADLHAQVKAYIESRGMTMAEFITAACDDLLPGDYGYIQRRIIQGGGLNIQIFGTGTVRGDDKILAQQGDVNRNLIKNWACDLVFTRNGIERIKSHGGEHIPRGHLTAVIVAGHTVVARPIVLK